MDVGGMISARSKKNTVNDRRMEMDRDTCNDLEIVKLSKAYESIVMYLPFLLNLMANGIRAQKGTRCPRME